MNMNNMISNMSEETMISLAVFIGAGLIYIMRKFSSLNQQIREFEQNDISGRESRDKELELVRDIISDIRAEYDNSKNHVEGELVEHEMMGLNMAPKFQELSRQIGDVLDEQSDSIIDVSRNIDSIASKINKAFSANSDNSLEQINNMIPQLVSKIDAINESVKSESQRVNNLLHEIYMIKRAIGVE